MADIIDVDAFSDVDPEISEQQQLEEAIALSLSESRRVIDAGADKSDVPREIADCSTSYQSTHETGSQAPVSDFIRERKLLEEARLLRRRKQLGEDECDVRPRMTEASMTASSNQFTELPAKRQ